MGDEKEVEQTLVLIKPDGLVKSLTGDIISKLSQADNIIVGSKIVSVSRELAEKHYHQLKDEKGEEIYEQTLRYIQGEYHTNRVLALIYQGKNAIEDIKTIAGETNPEKAHPESIRGRYGRIHSKTQVFENVIHASDSKENAEREIKLWFSPEEITNPIYPTENKKVEREELVWKEDPENGKDE